MEPFYKAYVNLKELKEVFRLVEKTDFSEVEIVRGDWKLRVARHNPVAQAVPQFSMYQPAPMHMPYREADTASIVEPVIPDEKTSSVEDPNANYAKSPFVGTFYRTPSPDAKPYVELGQTVKKGQTLCIVEAMKLMNEIECEFDGVIAEIYQENGQAVEFGEKLFRIDPK